MVSLVFSFYKDKVETVYKEVVEIFSAGKFKFSSSSRIVLYRPSLYVRACIINVWSYFLIVSLSGHYTDWILAAVKRSWAYFTSSRLIKTSPFFSFFLNQLYWFSLCVLFEICVTLSLSHSYYKP